MIGRLATRSVMTSSSRCPSVAAALFKSFAREDGCLSCDELDSLLRSGGMVLSPRHVQELHTKLDLDGSGGISEEEFAAGIGKVLSGPQTEEDLRRAFELVDRNGDGIVDAHELGSIINSSKRPLTSEEAHAMVARYAEPGSEGLTWPQFLRMCQEDLEGQWLMLTSFGVSFALGGPGSGKGTVLGHVAAARPDVEHVSCGDLLRAEIEEGTALGREVADIMRRGELVSASVVIALLDKRFASARGRHVVLDGFPRSIQNVEDFYTMFGMPLNLITFQCPDDVMVERIVERGKTSGRADDNEEVARHRVAIYHEVADPCIARTLELGQNSVPIIAVDTQLDVERNSRTLIEKLR